MNLPTSTEQLPPDYIELNEEQMKLPWNTIFGRLFAHRNDRSNSWGLSYEAAVSWGGSIAAGVGGLNPRLAILQVDYIRIFGPINPPVSTRWPAWDKLCSPK